MLIQRADINKCFWVIVMSDIKLEGMEEINKALKKIADDETLKRALTKSCLVVEREAKKKAPKGVGDLRKSIQHVVGIDGGKMVGIVFTPLEYAPYVEFGTGLFAEDGGRQDVPWYYQDEEGEWHSTSGMKPTPFLRPALLDNKQKILEIIKEECSKKDDR